MTNPVDPRILFAAERTLLAWNRTSLTLIAFGFFVERSGLLMLALAPGKMQGPQVHFTFWCGVGFIFLGIFCAIYSSRQHLRFLKTLSQSDIPAGYRTKWGVVVNGALALLALSLILLLFANSTPEVL